MKLSKAVSIRLNQLLGEHNLSSYKLSRITGLAPNTIQGLMSCRNEDVKLSTIILIANSFGMHVSEFLKDANFEFDNLLIEK